MKLIKLIPGQMNVLLIKCKAGYATGARRPKVDSVKQDVVFNSPVLCIKLRKFN
jgi:hypothetical protein